MSIEVNATVFDEVQALLYGFGDVYPGELPRGLPPMKGIEYRFDLIPGAILLNKLAYKVNPEEIRELKG